VPGIAAVLKKPITQRSPQLQCPRIARRDLQGAVGKLHTSRQPHHLLVRTRERGELLGGPASRDGGLDPVSVETLGTREQRIGAEQESHRRAWIARCIQQSGRVLRQRGGLPDELPGDDTLGGRALLSQPYFPS